MGAEEIYLGVFGGGEGEGGGGCEGEEVEEGEEGGQVHYVFFFFGRGKDGFFVLGTGGGVV